MTTQNTMISDQSTLSKMFKEENSEFDLNDPRQDHNLEIKEYNILDSWGGSVKAQPNQRLTRKKWWNLAW